MIDTILTKWEIFVLGWIALSPVIALLTGWWLRSRQPQIDAEVVEFIAKYRAARDGEERD
jgi:hypothetical protein